MKSIGDKTYDRSKISERTGLSVDRISQIKSELMRGGKVSET